MTEPTTTAALTEKEALERVAAVFDQWRHTDSMTNFGLAALVLDAVRFPRSDGTVPQ